jgi:hypothetical protein
MTHLRAALRIHAPPVPSPLRGEGDFHVPSLSHALSLARPIKYRRDAVAPLPSPERRVRVGHSLRPPAHRARADHPTPGGRHDRH